jgi:hypothetical protein
MNVDQLVEWELAGETVLGESPLSATLSISNLISPSLGERPSELWYGPFNVVSRICSYRPNTVPSVHEAQIELDGFYQEWLNVQC